MSRTLLATFTSPSPESTARFARDLATRLGPGDTICLEGPLGAGKSHLARSAIQSLTGETHIPSPTYTLVQTYDGPACEIWHCDLYRLGDAGEIEEIGLRDAFATEITFVEWPDLLTDPPAAALWIRLDRHDAPELRTITLSGDPAHWADRLPVVPDD